MISKLIAIVYLVALTNLVFGYSHHFCVQGGVKESNKTCLKPDSGVCCGSLSYLLSETIGGFPSSSQVLLMQNTSLNETVYFKNLQDIALVGNTSTLSCYGFRNAGLIFINVTGLEIANLTIENCGSIQNVTNAVKRNTQGFISTLYILNSKNITFDGVRMINSVGTGVVLLDTIGLVHFSLCTFHSNKVQSSQALHYSGGGGVLVEFTFCSSGLYQNCSTAKPIMHNNSYVFNECSFTGNNASTVYPNITSFIRGSGNSIQGFGNGGGLSIGIKGSASNNSFIINNCCFQNNSGVWGGGIFLQLRDFVQDNLILIKNSSVISNHAYMYGGGGADVGYVFSEIDSPENNNITFSNCSFHDNNATTSGGGLAIFSNFATTTKNFMEFRECNLSANKARFGSAVEVAPEVWETLGTGKFLSPQFVNCVFRDNELITISRPLTTCASHADAKYLQYGIGVFLISRAKVLFQGNVLFYNNTGTAIYLTSGTVEFLGGTYANFSANHGQYGGALSLVGYSSIVVNNHSRFDFIRNDAFFQGGAIHVQSIDEHKYTTDRSCFIQYNGDDHFPVAKRNITFNFVENVTPTGDGNAIYAASFLPCSYVCPLGSSHSAPYLQCIVTVTGKFGGDINTNYNVTSKVMNYTLEEPFNSSILTPGKYFSIPLMAVDELGHEKNIVYQMSVQNIKYPLNDTSAPVSVTGGPDSQLHLFGHSGDSGTLVLANDDTVILFDFALGDCPPGYLWESRNGMASCYCSISNYFGIEHCNDTEAQVYMYRTYWMGYCNESQQNLCTGHCPVGYCNYGFPGTNVSKSLGILLPEKSSDLDEYICESHRKGVLCGSCRENYSAYYHSPSVRCGDETHCRLGILFYIISELIPVTVIFVIVMLFSVNFTSGKATGFILFAQIMDSISLSLEGRIYFPGPIYILLQILQVVYGFFNLDFFAVESLSFCLWKGANAMDVIAMKYLTVVYALSLVVITVLAMKSSRLVRCFSCLRVRTLKTAFISGITAFLIMCYSQCTKASIEIFSVTSLYTHGPTFSRTVLFHSGDTSLFDREHLKYAVPALLFIAVIVVIPPLLLVVYPLVFKALSYCSLNEARLVTPVSRLIPMQILDVFQSCYKDKFRFFAGLYFLYRTFVQMFVAAISGVGTHLYVVEAFFIILLAIHAMVQPYKKKLYNIIDSLIFMNLALINGITLYNYSVILSPLKYEPTETTIAVMSSIQVVLISCPLIILVLWGCKKQLLCRSHAIVEVDLVDESTLPLLRDERNSVQ